MSKNLYDSLGIPDPEVPDPPKAEEYELLDLTGPAFCRGVVNSRQYRQTIVNRILSQSLPPAVECRLLDQAWGRPTERVEVKDTTNHLEGITGDQLEERALQLAKLARQLKQAEAANVVDVEPSSSDDETASIH